MYLSEKIGRAGVHVLSVCLLTVFHTLLGANVSLADEASAGVPRKPVCSPEKLDELRSPATADQWRVVVDCSVRLSAGDVIEKEVYLEGEEGSRVDFECNNATLGNVSRASRARGTHRLVIRTRHDDKNGAWHPPHDILVSDCRIEGTMRIEGMAGEPARLSSLQSGHTERAQSAAPRNILVSNTRFVGSAKLFKLIVGVGVTDVTISNAIFEGDAVGVSVYLSDEAARIQIRGSRFLAIAKRREQVAIDGAAQVTIENNVFTNVEMGGVFIYRNCGERGRVRIQAPMHNVIRSNIFANSGSRMPKRPTIWIGSRNVKRSERHEQCILDDGFNLGSSLATGTTALSERDEARENQVLDNRFVGLDPVAMVRDDDLENIVLGNSRAPVGTELAHPRPDNSSGDR